jgi:cytochrome c-type biogenesis protein CcmF
MIAGITATALTFISLILSIVAYYLYYNRKEESLLRIGRMGFYTATGLIFLQGGMLLWGILTHHFEWSYVFSYSSKELPVYYLISTFWAGQEGTFMLWLILGSIYGLIIIRSRKEEEPLVMSFLNLAQAFIVIILIKKNPFSYVWEMNPNGFSIGQTPVNGSGLNPLLQDPWMTIHPPILFAGYSSTMILFAFAMSALIKRNYDNWIKPVYPFTLFVSLSLGTGIILGGYWAYTTLGWGGYWGWDPVENSSFIPWIISLALVHGIIIQRKQGGMKKTNIFLALLTFILVLYGSFLTRSGVLTDFSVHSFGESELTRYLIGFVLLFTAIAFLTFLFRAKEVKGERVQTAFYTRESFVLFGILVLLALAILTFIGTSSPLITGLVGKASNVSVDYYNTLAGPIASLLALLIGLSPLLNWKRSSADKLKAALFHGAISIFGGVIAFILGLRDLIPLIITILAFFVVLINGQLVYQMAVRKSYGFGGYVAHVGIGLMLFGIITSSVYDRSVKVTLPLDTNQRVMGYDLQYSGKIASSDGKDKVTVKVNGKETHAKFYWSNYSQAYMVAPSVVNTILQDLYISPIQIIPPNENQSRHNELALKKGELLPFKDFQFRFVGYDMDAHEMGASEIMITAKIDVLDKNGKALDTVKPSWKMQGNKRDIIPANLPGSKDQIFISNISVESGTIILGVTGMNPMTTAMVEKELLAVEVSVKPLINILWIGTVLMIIGFILSTIQYAKRDPLKVVEE